MRTVVAKLAILLAVSCPLVTRGQQATLVDELDVLYPDAFPASEVAHLESDTARGVPAGVHIQVAGLPGKSPVRWKLTLNDAILTEARAFQLIDVPVEQNTGLNSRTEAWDGQKNPHVIRRSPFRVFEALEPMGDIVEASSTGVLAFRLEVPIAAEAEVGPREYVLGLEAGSWRQALRWELNVHPVTVPPTGPQSPGYTNWFSTDVIAQRHGLEPWSEPFWEMLARYVDLMVRGRQNTFWIRWGDFVNVGADASVTLDRRRFLRYVRLFLDRGFTRIEGGHLAHRHQGDWGSPRLDISLTGSDVNSDKGRSELEAILTEVKSVLADLDLPAQTVYLQHLSDEPTDTNAESYKALAEQVRRHIPRVKIFEATTSLALVGAVDHWCPKVQDYQQHRDFFEERKRSGEGVWVYTCLAPGGPWLNRLLDQERLRPVYLGWALIKYDLAGFLHWGLNHYRPGVDPFTHSVVPHGDGPPNFLPAGDSHVVYPGKDAPLSGQRFEAQRIGMEDAELLRLLMEHDRATAETIVARVFRKFDD